MKSTASEPGLNGAATCKPTKISDVNATLLCTVINISTAYLV